MAPPRSPMRQFPSAPHPEIMRADQKDSDYLNHLCEASHEAFRSIFGQMQATAYQNEIKFAGQVLYYILTTGLGIQTLGEEYSNIIQVAGKSGLPLTPARRMLLVLFETVVPYTADKIRREISRASLSSMDASINSLNLVEETVSPRPLRQQILSQWPTLLPSIKEGLMLMSRANLMVFYFKGVYYDIAKRLAGVQYALLSRSPSSRTRYHMLGVFLLIQLFISGGNWLQKIITSIFRAPYSTDVQGAIHRDRNSETSFASYGYPSQSDAKYIEGIGAKCTLCLGSCRWPTSTPCGHVFCWDCVAESCNQKLECPLCRSKLTHSELIPIYNAGC